MTFLESASSCLLMYSRSSVWTPKYFSRALLSHQASPILHLCTSCFPPEISGNITSHGPSGTLTARCQNCHKTADMPLDPLCTSYGAMGRKRLITDSFQVVKRKRGSQEAKEAQSPPQDLVQAESHLQDAAQPDQLEILKQFDFSWQYGPCTV
ncbi:DNA polymerase delta subunit 4 isoform 3-T3 [Liasis olivaceus]